MEKLLIKGGGKLKGEISVKGAKNCALKVMAASLLTDEYFDIKNIPQIEDVHRMIEILKDIGIKVEKKSKNHYVFEPGNKIKNHLNEELVPQLRSSIVLLGPMLAKYKKIIMPHPGGCAIGKRPIDIFIKGLKALGAKVQCGENSYTFETKGLIGTRFVFPKVSVTGTETLMMAATLAKGKTILVNAACEPEIPALADFLNSAGAKIEGAGTPFIEITGVDKIGSGTFEVIPDRIEAFSFLVLAAATKSTLQINKCNPSHLETPIEILKNIGVNIEVGKDFIKTKPYEALNGTEISTREYPGFPTDCQAPLTVLLTQANGVSSITETIFEDRFMYTDLLNRMGANIQMVNQQRIIIKGPTKLKGKEVESPDLRAGIAMVIAALIAEGETIIDNVYQINRGYEDIANRLKSIGANIKKI